MHPIILLRHREEFGLALVIVTPLFTALKTQAIVLLENSSETTTCPQDPREMCAIWSCIGLKAYIAQVLGTC